MADPFRPNSKSQLFREAQIGLSVVAILLVLLVYVAFYRITGRGRHLPDHVRDAPVANLVWPNNTQRAQQLAQAETEMTPQQFRDRHLIKPGMVTRRSDFVERNQSSARKLPPGNVVDTMPKRLPKRDQVALPTKKHRVANPALQTKRPASASIDATHVETQPKKNHQDFLANIKPDGLVDNKTTPMQHANPFVDPVTPIPFAQPSKTEIDKSSELKLASMELADQETKSPNVFKPKVDHADFSTLPKSPSPEPDATSVGDLRNKNDSAFQPFTSDLHPEKSSATNALRLDVQSQASLPIRDQREENGTSKHESGLTGFSPQAELSPLTPSRPQAGNFQVQVMPVEQQQDDGRTNDQVKLIAPKPILVPPPADESTAKPLSSNHLQATESSRMTTAAPATFAKSDPPEVYVVEPGDSYWSIAQKAYEDGRFFRELFKHNESSSPEFDVLLPGSQIITPPISELVRNWPEYCPGTESTKVAEPASGPQYYVTKAGDTLFEIAGKRLDQASRYLEVAQMNQQTLGSIQSTTPLRAGIKLVLPPK